MASILAMDGVQLILHTINTTSPETIIRSGATPHTKVIMHRTTTKDQCRYTVARLCPMTTVMIVINIAARESSVRVKSIMVDCN